MKFCSYTGQYELENDISEIDCLYIANQLY